MAGNEIREGGAVLAALTADLLFATRIRGSASHARTTQSVQGLLELLGRGTRLVLVDVQARDAEEAVRQARRRAPEAEVVAFGPHVAEAALAAARDAGAHRVLPRGAFVRELPTLVAGVEP